MAKFVGVAFVLSASLFLGTSMAFAKGDPQAGRIKANTCMGCHGIPSYTIPYPTRHVPKLGGQHAQYIISALKEYASNARHFPTMHAQASSLSEQDMQDIAAYLSQKKPGK